MLISSENVFAEAANAHRQQPSIEHDCKDLIEKEIEREHRLATAVRLRNELADEDDAAGE